MKKYLKSHVLILAVGIAIMLLAIFAELLGLDNDPGWGRGRKLLLVIGFATIVFSYILFKHSSMLSSKLKGFCSFMSPQVKSFVVYISRIIRDYWQTLIPFLLVVMIYIWFGSSGTWTTWTSPTRYYAKLAESFEIGELYLLEEPDQNLLMLSNPYDPLARKNTKAPTDYSLYKEKFYLYWGPVPALFLTIINPFIDGRIGDLQIAFGFLCGIFLSQYLLIILIWHQYFKNLPKWILILSILLIGLSSPTTFALSIEPNGRIYEAAIAGGQFFLLSGLFIAYTTLRNNSDTPMLPLIIAGTLWALSIGTRLVLIVPIGFLMLSSFQRIFSIHRSFPKIMITKMFLMGLPVALCIVALASYNWARFGSITETGFSYALASVNLKAHANDIFSPVYISQNLYNYLLAPLNIDTLFPFLHANDGIKAAILSQHNLPEVYSTQTAAGLIYIEPFILFAVIVIVPFFRQRFKNKHITYFSGDANQTSINWIIISLGGSFILPFALLLIFFWMGLRYTADFMPSLIILSTLGFWQGYQLLQSNHTQRILFSVFGITIACISIIANILLPLSINGVQFFF